MGDEPHPPRAGELGIEQLETAGRRVARIGKELFAALRLFGPQVRKIGVRDVSLAADLEQRRRMFRFEPQRDAADGSRVGRDVVPLPAVAAGQGLNEPSLLVCQ